ncbi:hydroxymethylglutaryl-CoA lyase [Halomonas sp. McH1-25]|uniref:hydroxymethylglutaryl-CoA lyase n=1 Tax=unclassified Halomonas TaxID=2609666 RepID=UPI001EF60D04|nr:MULTISPECIES: hydroxymethylglutaryl-CoA lyase [unclassified Halomonas]MCG7599855.1 hydroxymethylglutaryl-CoA lyase [Halomonas sp. McH1-25]MCP1343055.1 hydroxymethylglutaryl-CoA lyase [Halomonas sp. FL8]MCP1361577.1 hydroxymethylglutaryl-CoA lyase [Halomonas sp. BBD45]MCP1365918.1 hydroxymethylglutaryl-CoA lyase [Halomonas sp. BBD48]
MTILTPPARVDIVEVAPRDGFQSIREPLPTADKIRCIEALIMAGITRLEIGSFVSPRAIPQMADAGEIVAHFTRRPAMRFSALVPNLKGAQRALDSGLRELVYVVSVSESHNQGNVRQSVDASVAGLASIVELLHERDLQDVVCLRLDLGTSFDCPYEGTIVWQQVDAVLGKARDAVRDVSMEVALCDTTGRASPYQVADHFTRLRERHGDERLKWAFHGHDTYGMGVANALFAIHHGATALDAATAGLGGCPFAPGATGNTATEDLLYALHGGKVHTGVSLPRLLEAADLIAALPDGQTASHLRNVPRERVA